MTTRSGRMRTGRLRGVVAVVGLVLALVATVGGPVGAASPAGWSSTFTPIPGVKTKDAPAAVVFGGKDPHPNWLVGGVPCAINVHGEGAVGAAEQRLHVVLTGVEHGDAGLGRLD